MLHQHICGQPPSKKPEDITSEEEEFQEDATSQVEKVWEHFLWQANSWLSQCKSAVNYMLMQDMGMDIDGQQ